MAKIQICIKQYLHTMVINYGYTLSKYNNYSKVLTIFHKTILNFSSFNSQ